MEQQILDNLHTYKPVSTRKLMTACGVQDSRRVGHISDEAFDFVQLLEKMQASGHIRLIEGQGWIKTNDKAKNRRTKQNHKATRS